MPLEGQAERVSTPLRPRDRQVLVAVAILTVLAIVAGSVYAVTRPAAKDDGPCISFTVPASMGGATIRHCGADARHYCRVDAVEPHAVEACRNEGFVVGVG